MSTVCEDRPENTFVGLKFPYQRKCSGCDHIKKIRSRIITSWFNRRSKVFVVTCEKNVRNMKRVLTRWLVTQVTDSYQQGIEKHVLQYHECLSLVGTMRKILRQKCRQRRRIFSEMEVYAVHTYFVWLLYVVLKMQKRPQHVRNVSASKEAFSVNSLVFWRYQLRTQKSLHFKAWATQRENNFLKKGWGRMFGIKTKGSKADWNVTPYYKCFRAPTTSTMMKIYPPKRRYISTRPQGGISQKTASFTFRVMRT